MRGLRYGAVLIAMALAVAVANAAPPDVPADVKAPAGKVKEIVVKVEAGKDIAHRLVGGPAAFREMKSDSPAERIFWLVPETDSPAYIVWWTVGEKASALTEINKGAPAPVPPGPGPNPPTPPAPGPVDPLTSFRVIAVYESGDSLAADQKAIIYGKVVEDWLTANCTGGKAGWRRRDKDAPGENDATMATLWSAAKSGVTQTPCFIVARNNRVRIFTLSEGDTPAKVVETLQSLKGGK